MASTTHSPSKSSGRRSIEFSNTPMPIVSVSSPESEHAIELGNVTEEDEKIPAHHQVLFDLLGESAAEAILNPKMVEPASGRRSSMKEGGNHLRTVFPDIDTGMGADALWKLLKEKSSLKLKKMDNKIPDELKVAYGSFLREEISKQKSLAFRSFTEKEDVPDCNVLMKNDYEAKVRRIRSHSNIMHHAAVNNRNKATLLLSNNPLPEQKDKTLNRFFEETHFGKNWLPITSGQSTILRSQSQDSFQKMRTNLFSNLQYLTEKKATVPGTFYAKYDKQDDLKMVTEVPGYKVKLPPHMTARISISAPAHEKPRDWKKIESLGNKRQHDPKWQPLTAGALMEYASTKPMMRTRSQTNDNYRTWVPSKSVSV